MLCFLRPLACTRDLAFKQASAKALSQADGPVHTRSLNPCAVAETARAFRKWVIAVPPWCAVAWAQKARLAVSALGAELLARPRRAGMTNAPPIRLA